MRAKLDEQEIDKLSVIEEWGQVCGDVLDFHRDIRSRFWMTIQADGPDSELANVIHFDTIRTTERVDREMKVLLRKAKLIAEACEQDGFSVAKLKSMINEFFNTRKKYMKQWESFDERVTGLSNLIPDELDFRDELEDFPEF